MIKLQIKNLKLQLKNFEAYSVIPIPQYIFFFNLFNFKKKKQERQNNPMIKTSEDYKPGRFIEILMYALI